jgi:rhamnopyranosyl-N-acetylglucosaminyl-diphospho-decaprenol beta-1,3/1,4-galactofuranosyltransferase
MGKAIAVVVSYNRQKLLAECIAALRQQTHTLDAILVINNGSTDNTESWLKNQQGIITISQENLGSSGGFNTGISWAFENGYSWIWCMDDDGYPKADALENLLATNLNHLSLINCAVINKEDKKSFVWKTKNYKTIDDVDTDLIKGIGHPFNGTLIHRNIVERVGLPKPNLFLWGDESEYYFRITRRNKIPVYTVPASIHYHPAATFTYKNDWDFSSSWKMYFYVRNRFHALKSKCSTQPEALFRFLFFLIAIASVVIFYQRSNKIKKLSFIAWPALDAFKNNFAQTPTSILNRLNTNAAVKHGFSLGHGLKSTFQYIMNNIIPKHRTVVNG